MRHLVFDQEVHFNHHMNSKLMPFIFFQLEWWCDSVLGESRKHKMLSRASHAIALCSIANFINSADRVIMPIAIVPMADEYKWDLHGQGWVLSSFAVGYMSSQVKQKQWRMFDRCKYCRFFIQHKHLITHFHRFVSNQHDMK